MRWRAKPRYTPHAHACSGGIIGLEYSAVADQRGCGIKFPLFWSRRPRQEHVNMNGHILCYAATGEICRLVDTLRRRRCCGTPKRPSQEDIETATRTKALEERLSLTDACDSTVSWRYVAQHMTGFDSTVRVYRCSIASLSIRGNVAYKPQGHPRPNTHD